MPIITFGRFSLDCTFVTYAVPGHGTAGGLRVNSVLASPPLPGGHLSWALVATPSERIEFHRQQDALAQAAGVPAKLRRHPDLWQYLMDDPAREAHRLRLIEQNPVLGEFPYTGCM